ncbi:myo-inositol-1(or 4)-monophosphatase [Sphaerotilus mobilis]|uniref:inositol-phosphate phosphatase n=1 Tax=Sphaerotilus mobilis TaxID=47994 RepID=A0A4Q7LFY8_9BURK|nr:myo-inositol-1(or 4)-monophosphatase [Sphaerotilus mobilis]
MSQTNLHPMLNIAVKAARAGGAVISRASQDVDRLTVTSKGHNDFVTEVDQAAEAAVIDVILQAYPNHAILAEESGREHGSKHSDYTWIIDPLDGTTNFIHGYPQYAVSIALAYKGKVEQAVVYDPNRNDLFYATKGRGAFLNDKRLRVSKRIRMMEALIGTGFPFRKGDNFKRYMRMFEDVMTSCAGLRRPGAAALDLCYVAAGWLDGFFETGLSPWDVAAGSLIITEAGGLVGNFTGEADFLYQKELVCGSPKIYAQLVQILKPYTRVIADEKPEVGAATSGKPYTGVGGIETDATETFIATAGVPPGAYQGADATTETAAPADDATAADDAPAAEELPYAFATSSTAASRPYEPKLSPAQALAAAFEPTPVTDAPAPVVTVRKATRIRKEDLPPPPPAAPDAAPRARAGGPAPKRPGMRASPESSGGPSGGHSGPGGNRAGGPPRGRKRNDDAPF